MEDSSRTCFCLCSLCSLLFNYIVPAKRAGEESRFGGAPALSAFPNDFPGWVRSGSRSLLLYLVDISPRCRRELVPDAERQKSSQQRKRHQEQRPPVPAAGRQVAKAERLESAAQINKPIHDARARRGRLSPAEIGRRCTRHQGVDANDRHRDEERD